MYRNITLAAASAKSKSGAQAVFLADRDRPATGYAAADRAAGGAIAAAVDRPEFNADRGTVKTVYPTRGPERLFLVGLGPDDRIDGEALRVAAAKLVGAAFAAEVATLDLQLDAQVIDRLGADEAGMALADGLGVGNFSFDDFKGAAQPGDAGGSGKSATSRRSLSVRVDKPLRAAFGRGLDVGRAVATARSLAATPPNVANPRYVATFCRKLARQVGLKCTVLDAKRVKELGMGGITAVGQAGSTPPALICLEWEGPKGQKAKGPRKSKTAKHSGPLLLVGKAVTFDTGGYSLKVGGSMKGMKYDKCGGMTVIGAMEAIARLKLPRRVVALIPCVENMIDEGAYRVDDILTFYNGVTTEVTNTDAEGRLILADALAYGTQKYDPAGVIDLATLTGGVVVALGSYCAGMFCNDDALRERLDAAAGATGERLWRLPLWDDHRKLMRGKHADLVNSAPVREAHPIQGAAFLSYFVGKDAPRQMPTTPWAHLDIAGVASLDRESDLYPVGPTGFGVRLLTRLVMDWG